MIAVLLRVIAVVATIISGFFIFPLLVALANGEAMTARAFSISILIGLSISAVIFATTRGKRAPLGIRGAIVAVAASWLGISLLGSLPLYLSGIVSSFTDAFFESTSGFTTTGTTVISNIDELPKGINLWRCETHWLGGMGIIALTVAVLPLLGVGGFQLIKAETTGPQKGKITPKIATTAKMLWFIYLGLTFALFLSFKIAGMSLFDAVCHAFSTMGTGGYSTHNSSIGFYSSPAIEWIAIVFMFLAATNLSLYYYMLTGKRADVLKNSELRAFLGIIVVSVLLIYFSNKACNVGSFRESCFYVISIISTTGFVTTDYSTWSPAAKIVLFSLFFVGGCAGSTAGGIKAIRWVVLSKACHGEMLKMLHPHGVFTLRIDGKPTRSEIVGVVASFIYIYLAIVILTAIAGAISGLDPWSSLTGALSVIGNVGPAFGSLGPMDNFAEIKSWMKWWYSFAMLAGRLELYTLVIFFTRAFWVK